MNLKIKIWNFFLIHKTTLTSRLLPNHHLLLASRVRSFISFKFQIKCKICVEEERDDDDDEMVWTNNEHQNLNLHNYLQHFLSFRLLVVHGIWKENENINPNPIVTIFKPRLLRVHYGTYLLEYLVHHMKKREKFK